MVLETSISFMIEIENSYYQLNYDKIIMFQCKASSASAKTKMYVTKCWHNYKILNTEKKEHT